MSAGIDLLPCPFCGGPVDLERTTGEYERIHGQRQWFGARCRNTRNLGGDCCVEIIPSASKDAAVARWNMRAPVPALSAPVARPSDDALWDQTIRDRDAYHDWADKLANAIGAHFGVDIGEHSSVNLPWAEALDAIVDAAPVAQQCNFPTCKPAAEQDAIAGQAHVALYSGAESVDQAGAHGGARSAVLSVENGAQPLGKGDNGDAEPAQVDALADARDLVVARAIRDVIYCTGNPCITDSDLSRAILAAAPRDRAAPAAVAGWQLPACECFTEQQEQYCIRQRKCSKAIAYSADADRRDPGRLAIPSGIFDRRED